MCACVHVCMCVCVCARACVCVCVYACVGACVYQQRPNGLSIDLEIKRFQVQCSAGAAVISLSKELYSHCSSPPSCINGDLALAREANAKLSNLCGWGLGVIQVSYYHPCYIASPSAGH